MPFQELRLELANVTEGITGYNGNAGTQQLLSTVMMQNLHISFGEVVGCCCCDVCELFWNLRGVYWQQNDKNRKTTTLWTYPGAQEENDDPEAQIMILHHVNHDACTIWTLHLPTFAKAVFIKAYGVVVLFFGGFKGTLSVYNVNIYKYTLPKFHVVHLKIMVDTKFGIYYSRVPFSGYSTCSTFWGYVYWMTIKNSIYNDWST